MFWIVLYVCVCVCECVFLLRGGDGWLFPDRSLGSPVSSSQCEAVRHFHIELSSDATSTIASVTTHYGYQSYHYCCYYYLHHYYHYYSYYSCYCCFFIYSKPKLVGLLRLATQFGPYPSPKLLTCNPNSFSAGSTD